MKDYSMVDLIGNTPLVRLKNIEAAYNLNSKIYAKLERCNPTGSIKDRAVKEMILDAMEKKLIDKDTVLIEPTSGNTGIGFAAIGATLNMKVVLFMPSNCSIERVKMMKAFGADIRLVSEGGMAGCIAAAKQLHSEIKNSYIPFQFENKANSMAHYKTTGPEIFEQTEGTIDIFISAFGTGGTLTGTAKYLKEKKPSVLAFGVEPATSAVVTTGKKGPHKIQGIGAGFVPKTYSSEYIDEVFDVQNDDAIKAGRDLAQTEGILVGISSGAAAFAATEIAKRPENKGKKIVALLPDTGERYLSTVLYAFEEYPL